MKTRLHCVNLGQYCFDLVPFGPRRNNELPGIIAGCVRLVSGFDGHMFKTGLQTAHFRLSPQCARQGDQRTIDHFQAGSHAILDFDRIDPRCRLRINTLDRPHQFAHHIVKVNGLRQQNSTQLDIELSAPCNGVIIRAAMPMCFATGNIGLADQPAPHQLARFEETGSPPVLENRQDTAFRAGFGLLQHIHLGKRSHQRLFTNHMLACGQHGQTLVKMQGWRRADIDDIDIRHRQHLVKRGHQPFDTKILSGAG